MDKVIILSGASGAGKTTEANRLETTLTADGETVLIVSAQNFFLDEETGEYEFNPTKLEEAHGECLYDFTEALRGEDITVLIVDNANLTENEIAPYLRLATAYGWDVEIVVCRGQHESPHNVDKWRIQKQRGKQDATLKWWNVQDGIISYGSYRGTPVRVVE